MDSMTSLDLIGINKLNVPRTRIEDVTTAFTIDSCVFSQIPRMIPKFKASLLSLSKVDSKPSSSTGSPHLFSSRPISFKVGPKDNCDTPVSLDSSMSEDWPAKPVEQLKPAMNDLIEPSLKSKDDINMPVPYNSRKVCSESALSSSVKKLKEKKIEPSQKLLLSAKDREVKSHTLAAKKFDDLLTTNNPQNVKLELSAYKELSASKKSVSMSSLKPILSKTPRVLLNQDPLKKSPLSSTLGKKVSFAKNKILLVYNRT